MSRQSEARAAILFFRSAQKHKLGRGLWDLASCKVSLNFVWRFQRSSWKCLSQSVARVAILFSDRFEKHKLGRGRWDHASCQVSLNSVQRFQRRSQKCLSQSEARAAILFFRSARRYKLGRRHYVLASCQVSLNSVQRLPRRSRKCVSTNQRPGRPSCFSDRPEKTNLVEAVETMLPVKFRWIPFCGFRGEVENVSANQRPGRSSCFSNQPKKHKLGRGHWDFASSQVSLNSVQRFQSKSRSCLSQSESRAAILFFRSARKTQT